ncbi:DUF2339 domain-containing protein [Anaerotaenia torta]|uniref:DUF2339 domain-containing protein n=1 Tax=Anaerotaenia torta TaxID=433293 RepID=UPI003D1F4D53
MSFGSISRSRPWCGAPGIKCVCLSGHLLWIVAIGSISVGFKLRNKGIRLCGLILTIIMVARFIVVDLNQENSITRVLALIAGGGLCFLISFIYNKLSENYS